MSYILYLITANWTGAIHQETCPFVLLCPGLKPVPSWMWAAHTLYSVCVYLPNCIIQDLSRAHSVLSPYLHISNIVYVYKCTYDIFIPPWAREFLKQSWDTAVDVWRELSLCAWGASWYSCQRGGGSQDCPLHSVGHQGGICLHLHTLP